ncbi:MAG TPA: HAD family phosphatase [Roseiflexaceae bacterium]|nr:HAD family phosphatase [Roseiflexaceae bacterium]
MTLSPFTAAIFDMDGTLADNMPLHYEAFRQFMQRYDLQPPPAEIAAGLTGKRNREILPVLFGYPLSDGEIQQYSAEKEQIYHQLIAGLRPLPGLHQLLDILDTRGVPTAIATSAPGGNVPPMLDQLGVTGRFRVVTLGEEVAHGKPAPDIFLEAARRLGADPATCLVFEDAYAGIEAAHAAGMQCVALATTHTHDQLRRLGPAAIITDYEDFLPLLPSM